MRSLKKLLILSILVTAFFSFGQKAPSSLTYQNMMKDMTVNFYTVCDSAEAFFKSIDRNKKGSGYKPFMRWKNEFESKYSPSGNRMVDHYLPFKTFEKIKSQQNKNQQQQALNQPWEALGPAQIGTITGHYAPGLGRLEFVEVNAGNAQQIYLGSRSGGLWRTNDEGATWSQNTDFLPASGVNAIAAKPNNFNSVLINVQTASLGNSFGIYRSVNGGNNFVQTNFNPTALGFGGLGSNFKINIIKYHPRVANVVFVGTDRGVFRSTDDLQTWVRSNNSWNVQDIDFHPTDNNIVYLHENSSSGGNRNRILKSTNQGVSYLPLTTLATNNNREITIGVSASCANCIFLFSESGVWKSTDSGSNFVNIQGVQPQNEDHRYGAPSDTDHTKIVAGYVDLFRSTNTGDNFNKATWWSLGSIEHGGNSFQDSFNSSQVYVHADNRYITCVNGVFYVCTDGFLCKSTNNGQSWTRLNSNMSIRENYNIGISQSNNERIICGAQDNGTIIKTENGWTEYTGADGMEGIIHPLNENWMIGSWQYGTRVKTYDGGLSNTTGAPNGILGDWKAPMLYDPNNQMTVYSFAKRVHKSLDFGKTWQVLGVSDVFDGNNIMYATIAENDSQKILATYRDDIKLSTDGGVSFVSIKNNLPDAYITDVVFDPKNDNTIIVTYNTYNNDNEKIYLSTDSGDTWTNITHNLGSMPVNCVVVDSSAETNIYIGTEIGVYTKTMAATNWELFNTALPNVAIKEMEINQGSQTLFASSWGRGSWKRVLRNKQSFPKIVYSTITNQPTEQSPKFSVPQFVTSKINYTGTISTAFVSYATGTPTFTAANVIPMTFQSGTTWRSNSALPDFPVGTKVFFKVTAVGSSNDVSDTYKFMYEVKPFVFCTSGGVANSTGLYITNFSCAAFNAPYTSFSAYALNNTTPINLTTGVDYQTTIKANTTWLSNDFAVWIDYNKDAEFTENEKVFSQSNAGQQASGNFVVPNNALLGQTRMRVRLGYYDDQIDNPCGNTLGNVKDYVVNIQASLSTDVFKNNLEVKLYPNPFKNELTFEYPVDEKITFEIINILGQVSEKGSFSRKTTIDTQKYADGNYFVKFSNGAVIKIKKVIKN